MEKERLFQINFVHLPTESAIIVPNALREL